VAPTCHPRAQVVPAPDSAAAAESELCTRPRAWPARQGVRPGYLRPPPPPGPPTRATRVALCPSREPSETLAAAAVESSSSPLSRRREAVQELRLEVSNVPVPLVVEFVHCRNRETSPEFVTRAATSTGRSAVSPPQPSSPSASPSCALHVDVSRASNPALEPWIGFAGESRRRSPPVAAVGRRSPPPRRSRARPVPLDQDPASQI
jgi:hypothetical protein